MNRTKIFKNASLVFMNSARFSEFVSSVQGFIRICYQKYCRIKWWTYVKNILKALIIINNNMAADMGLKNSILP